MVWPKYSVLVTIFVFEALTISKILFSSFYQFSLLLASERSERDTYRGNTIENRGCLFIYYRASETLTGVTQSKIGDVYLFIGERA